MHHFHSEWAFLWRWLLDPYFYNILDRWHNIIQYKQCNHSEFCINILNVTKCGFKTTQLLSPEYAAQRLDARVTHFQNAQRETSPCRKGFQPLCRAAALWLRHCREEQSESLWRTCPFEQECKGRGKGVCLLWMLFYQLVVFWRPGPFYKQ